MSLVPCSVPTLQKARLTPRRAFSRRRRRRRRRRALGQAIRNAGRYCLPTPLSPAAWSGVWSTDRTDPARAGPPGVVLVVLDPPQG